MTATPDSLSSSVVALGSFGFTPGGVVVCENPQCGAWKAFAESEPAGLIALGGQAAQPGADAPCLFWKSVADHFIRNLCQIPDAGNQTPDSPPPPDAATLATWTLNAPPMRGAEYLSPNTLRLLWERLADWTRSRISSEKSIAAFLQRHAPAWSRVGRVTLHLAENKNDPDCPFAFMASYASGLSQSGRLTQLPLGQALQEFSGAKNKRKNEEIF